MGLTHPFLEKGQLHLYGSQTFLLPRGSAETKRILPITELGEGEDKLGLDGLVELTLDVVAVEAVVAVEVGAVVGARIAKVDVDHSLLVRWISDSHELCQCFMRTCTLYIRTTRTHWLHHCCGRQHTYGSEISHSMQHR